MNVIVPLEIIKASEIEPKEVKWLWYPYIPFGKVTLLQGDPGDGKSKLMLSIAALLSDASIYLTGTKYILASESRKRKQAKKKDRSVSRPVGVSVVWKDNQFHYTRNFMTSWYVGVNILFFVGVF